MSTGEEKAESQSKQWLIVYCEKDESFSLIQESEAVCDKSILETNDKVIFFFQGEAWQGEVRAIGGDEDYDDLVHRLKEMNALNRKKDSSFHADQPRKTRGGKYAAAIQTLVPRSKTQVRPIAGKNTIEVKPNSGKDDILSGSETEDASSSSESPSTSPLPEELSPNDVRKTAQLKRRGADNDVMILKKMRTEMNQNLNNAPTQELTRRTSIIGFKNTFGTESDEETTCDQEGTEENFEGEEPDEGKEADKKKKKADDKKKKEADDKKKRESDDKKKKEADDKKKKEADDKKKKEPDDKKKKESDDKKIKEADDKKKKEADDKKKKEADDKRKEADDKKKKEANDKKKKEADDKKKEANDKKKKEAQDKRKEEAGESNSSDEGGQKEGNKEESESSGPETDKGVESQEEKLSEDEEKTPNRKTKKKKKKDKKSKGEPLKADFKVLRWTKDDDDVVEIAGKSNDLSGKHFFISRDDFQKAKSAKAASTFSKALLMGAFTDEALLKCSVSGGEYRAGGRANITRKPALPADVVAVIIDNAMYRQSGKKWSPTLNKKEIMNGLRQKLVDVRGRLRKKFESSD